MTNARLARVPRPDIDYASLSFNPDDPEPLPEAMYQYPILEEILPILGAHLNRLHSREEVFRSSNTFICYNPDNLNVRVGPDFYFASGVDAPGHRGDQAVPALGGGETAGLRAGNRLGEHGGARRDRQAADLRGDRHSRILALRPQRGSILWCTPGRGAAGRRNLPAGAAERRAGRHPQGIQPRAAAQPVLGQRDARFYDPESGEYLRNFEAEQAARQAEQARADSEQAARERAEAGYRELQEELERRDRES